MTRREQIKNAYRLTGGNANFYDGMMTYSTPLGKACLYSQVRSWTLDVLLASSLTSQSTDRVFSRLLPHWV